ncbi:hypothetical protein HH214_21600 (plasmid) [Mucilaginibacter robiniae]|uniref:DUF5045 domain-containing protein n=1 Tax=Mucilaginibacter robiniae TaxID=2728022 RepID=A0A7L5E688_9SPHI|nr:hypothetical protein [Mucilaginibacter robiniae]QJD98555.1 hypothetical protein HH214_21600 [Mucilaginibacter robiniae]
MKTLTILILLITFSLTGFGQMVIRDEANIYQEERMVYKQWDKNKFKPEFKWYNPGSYYAYALTWLLMPDYKNGPDLRPLRAGGEQTQRLALAAAMQVTSNYYKKEADTLRNTAITELANYSGAVSGLDPLYNLYYKKELAPLDNIEANAFKNVSANVINYMGESGAYNWYLTEMNSLKERFDNARKVDLDRGQRILLYHRILLEYRKISGNWKYKLSSAQMMLAYQEKMKNKNTKGSTYFNGTTSKTDDEIMKDILNKRKALTP